MSNVTLWSNSSLTISVGFRWGDCGRQVFHVALHRFHTWSNSPYNACRCVWVIALLITNDGHTKSKTTWDGSGPCWLSEPWILNESTTVVPANHYTSSSALHMGNHTCRSHMFTFASQIHSSCMQKSQIWTYQTKEQIFHWYNVNSLGFLARAIMIFLQASVSCVFFVVILNYMTLHYTLHYS